MAHKDNYNIDEFIQQLQTPVEKVSWVEKLLKVEYTAWPIAKAMRSCDTWRHRLRCTCEEGCVDYKLCS